LPIIGSVLLDSGQVLPASEIATEKGMGVTDVKKKGFPVT
jgi:hypothetical protein